MNRAGERSAGGVAVPIRGRRWVRWLLGAIGVLLVAAFLGRGHLREGRAWLYGLDAYAYGFPLVMMDLTKEVSTAVPTAGETPARNPHAVTP